LVSYAQSDRLLMGSPLRRRGVCLVTSASAIVVLAFATIVHLGLIGGMRADVMAVFLQALVLSSLLAAVPLAVLWYLDRRERETPWLFAAAFLWGGCIATTLALPVNTAFFLFVDAIVAQEPAVREMLGPDAAM
jgi:protease PrsW